ncbi:MaoC family dehydratase [Mangrovimicrobium sediminis]|uniref:MaoC family dehydratase n=1 Tax=Mangrovimicrobium sediminis TaxID=2562682 RepID=A0A4Z0LV45_9GAMM|nr:MaoC family dehydratase [Haliea sp. SAOS-164]TGD71263.1 MaoC family dehydratase [Haliea sp. SAOS-164]
MPFTCEEISAQRADDVPFSYADTQMLLYNLSVGMGRDPYDENELPYVFEHPALKVVPTAATVLGGGGAAILGAVDIDWTMVLHGEQRLTCHRPLPAAAELIGSTYISEVVDKGPEKGAIVTLEVDVRLAGGEPLYTMQNVIFMRGNGGCGGLATSAATPHTLPEREPDMVHVSETRQDQALLYRLNGDRNPLHAEPAFAARAGFPKPILHGLCSYGIACRALLASVCDYDPARIRRFDVRFTSPVFPGETIHTDIWVDGDAVSFRCRVPARDIVSINNGYCELNPA